MTETKKRAVELLRAAPQMAEDIAKPGIGATAKPGPAAIEYVVRGDEPEDQIDRLIERGITPVVVEGAGNTAELFA